MNEGLGELASSVPGFRKSNVYCSKYSTMDSLFQTGRYFYYANTPIINMISALKQACPQLLKRDCITLALPL